MSHHGKNPFEPEKDDDKPQFQSRRDLTRSLLDNTGFIGALGEHPKGKLTKDDEGAILFAIGEHDGKVVIDFGTPVHWLGMTPQEAAEFASTLLRKAREVGRKNGETISFMIG